MGTITDQAAALRIGLVSGFVTCADVVAWADALIADDHGPEAPQLFDLALLRPGDGDLGTAVTLLDAIPGDADVRGVWRKVAGDIRLALLGGRLADRDAATILFRLAVHGACPDDHIRDQCYALDDGFDLALQKVYGSVDSVRSEMLQRLADWSGQTGG